MAGNLARTTHRASWSIVAVLSVVAAGLLVSLAERIGTAPDSPSVRRGPSRTFMMAGQISRETYGLYLVDEENKTISVYQVVPKGRKSVLRLMASRTYAYDVRLDDYNTEPKPGEIKQLVEQHRTLDEKP